VCTLPLVKREMRADNLLERMRASPRGDWRIADVERLCRAYGLRCAPPSGGGSHYTARAEGIETILTIPARRPIKPVYIRQLVQLIDRVRAERRGR
jgi:hypothetical protein